MGRAFGHLAYQVDDIYALCAKLQAGGVTINRPPRDGHMAFVRSPDNVSIELLQKGARAAARRTLGLDAEHRRLVKGDASLAQTAGQVPISESASEPDPAKGMRPR